ncbi:MAG: hypothetical protein PVI88_00170 [Nitrosopumilaceae archaeon]|jgi:hypothetical protein
MEILFLLLAMAFTGFLILCFLAEMGYGSKIILSLACVITIFGTYVTMTNNKYKIIKEVMVKKSIRINGTQIVSDVPVVFEVYIQKYKYWSAFNNVVLKIIIKKRLKKNFFDEQ